MSQTETDLFKRYVAACDYPGTLDVSAVESALKRYLKALGIKRRVVRLKANWSLLEDAALERYVWQVIAELSKRAGWSTARADHTGSPC